MCVCVFKTRNSYFFFPFSIPTPIPIWIKGNPEAIQKIIERWADYSRYSSEIWKADNFSMRLWRKKKMLSKIPWLNTKYLLFKYKGIGKCKSNCHFYMYTRIPIYPLYKIKNFSHFKPLVEFPNIQDPSMYGSFCAFIAVFCWNCS